MFPLPSYRYRNYTPSLGRHDDFFGFSYLRDRHETKSSSVLHPASLIIAIKSFGGVGLPGMIANDYAVRDGVLIADIGNRHEEKITSRKLNANRKR